MLDSESDKQLRNYNDPLNQISLLCLQYNFDNFAYLFSGVYHVSYF